MLLAAAEACEGGTTVPDAIIAATLIVAGAAVAIVFIWRVLS